MTAGQGASGGVGAGTVLGWKSFERAMPEGQARPGQARLGGGGVGGGGGGGVKQDGRKKCHHQGGRKYAALMQSYERFQTHGDMGLTNLAHRFSRSCTCTLRDGKYSGSNISIPLT